VYTLGKLGTLVRLDLKSNNLQALPDDLSTSLPTLQHLDVSSNQLTQLPPAIMLGFKWVQIK
jgi:Leucine-rich repeat (LRR) protein